MFNFTPLLGAQTSSRASQSLLEFEGGIKILVDVGWDATGDGSDDSPYGFDVRQLKELEKHIPTLSLVLLTHPTLAHIGAFAHACKHFPLFRQIPIYATTPVISLGQTLLQDLYASTPAAAGAIPEDSLGEGGLLSSSNPTGAGLGGTKKDREPGILYQAPTTDELRTYFALINDLKYSQPHEPLSSPFSPPLNGLTITAYNAGHTLGGTIWHVQHGMESVVYAVDWNQTKENILGGAAWLGTGGAGGAEVIEQLRKPTALICSTKGVERTPLPKARRDERLLDMLKRSIERGGTALVPSDSSARILEIAYLLERVCADEGVNGPLKRAKVYLAGKSMASTVRYAKAMIEWMSDSVVREFESRDLKGKEGQQQADRGPFDFRFVKIVERQKRLDKILEQSGPKIILASDENLDWGYSKTVLESISADKDSCVILTEEYRPQAASEEQQSTGAAGTLGQSLWKWYTERLDGVAVETGSDGQSYEQAFSDNRELAFDRISKVPLEGKELAIYQNFLATRRQLQDTMQGSGATGLEASADAVDEASSDSSSSTEASEEERQGKALNFSAVNQASKGKGAGPKEAQGVNALLKEPGFFDWDVRGKKGREAMFPFPQKRRRLDDFGEIIRPEDYLRAEERDEIEGQDLRQGEGQDQGLGQKRKWDDAVNPANGAKHGSAAAAAAAGAGASKRRRMRPGPGERNGAASDSGYQTGDADADSEETDSESESDSETPDESLPSKLTRTRTTITANMRIAYVDFSGVHDQRSLTMLLPLISPRKLLLVGGTKSETTWLANEMARKMQLQLPDVEGPENADILMPLNGEMAVASMDTHAWTVRLSRSLTRRLQWQKVRGFGIVTLTGRLEAGKPPETAAGHINEEEESGAARRKRQKLRQSSPSAGGGPTEPDTSGADKPPDENVPATGALTQTTSLAPILDVLPANLAAATRTISRPIYVGDLRLALLRKELRKDGHRAEFQGEGTLVVDGIVAVRKSLGGRIEVEGSESRETARFLQPGRMGGTFWEVKKRIYEGLAVIAGG